MVKVFEAIDVDGSGTVSGKDLQQVVETLGLPITDSDAAALIAQSDTDGTVSQHPLSSQRMASSLASAVSSIESEHENSLSQVWVRVEC